MSNTLGLMNTSEWENWKELEKSSEFVKALDCSNAFDFESILERENCK